MRMSHAMNDNASMLQRQRRATCTMVWRLTDGTITNAELLISLTRSCQIHSIQNFLAVVMIKEYGYHFKCIDYFQSSDFTHTVGQKSEPP